MALTSYLAYGAPEYSQAIDIGSPEGVRTRMTVNVFGDITQISQGGVIESRAYDNFHYLCKVSRSDVGTTVMTNNVLGEAQWQAYGVISSNPSNCTSTNNQASRVNFVYDNVGDLSTADYVDINTPDITRTYDNNGNLLSLNSRIGTQSVLHTYTYNEINLLESERLDIGSDKQLSLDYDYNLQGYVNRLTYPNGDSVTYSPNGFGEPTEASGNRIGVANMVYADNVVHYPTGQLDSFNYANGIAHKTTLNVARLPVRIEDVNSGVSPTIRALDYAYQYDNSQNITRLTDNLDSGFSLTALTYDGLDRLTNVVAGSGIGNSSIVYDTVGNITQYTTSQQSLDYVYNTNNQLVMVNKVDAPQVEQLRAFSYDNRGNVTSNGFRSFGFNIANQLQGSLDNNYLYDGHNRRVRQTDSQGTSYSLYSQDGTLLYRETDDGPINYIYLGKKLIAKDGFVADKSADQHFYPYGSSVEGEVDDIGYTGHKFDKDLDLVYMQARYYDPMIGRFYSNDPVDSLGQFNLENYTHGFGRYTYANNNPYKYIDPDGRNGYAAIGAYIGTRLSGGTHEEALKAISIAVKGQTEAGKQMVSLTNLGPLMDAAEIAIDLSNGESVDGKLGSMVAGEAAGKLTENFVEKKFGNDIGEAAGTIVNKVVADTTEHIFDQAENNNVEEENVDSKK
jgi:RHS repeat-associated protein